MHIGKHFISAPQYKQQIRHFNEQIETDARCQYEASEKFRLCYEGLVKGEKSIDDFRAARDIAIGTKAELDKFMANKAAYDEQYQMFYKLLRVSARELPLGEIIGYINQIMVDKDRQIVVKW